MKRVTQSGLLLAVVCCATLSARADAVGDYKVILERNPFGLIPKPVPPPPPTNAPPETPTNYKLTGITALFKPRRAMFVNQVPGKPTPEYISLSEGQRQGSLEILADGINVKAGTVRVKISGEERTMSFEKDGLKSAGAPAMTAPGAPPFAQLNPVQPAPGGTIALPPPNFQGGYQNGQGSFNPGAMPAAMQPAPAAAQGSFGGVPSTARQVRIPIGDAAQVQSSPPPAPKIDPVEQAVRMEIQQKIYEKTPGDFPPLPPSDLRGR